MAHLTAWGAETFGATERDSVIAEVTRRLATTGLEPAELLATVLTDLSGLGPGTWVGSLINRDANTIQVRAASSSNHAAARYIEDLTSSGEAVAWSIASQVVETGKPIARTGVPRADFEAMLTPEVRSYVAEHPSPVSRSLPSVSYVVVPMRSRGALMGTLGLFDFNEPSEFEQPDLQWMQEVADRTGAAIENAQLFADATVRYDRLAALHSVGLAIATTSDLYAALRLVIDQVVNGLRAGAGDPLLLDDSGTTMVSVAHAGFRSTSLADLRLPVEGSNAAGILNARRVDVRSGSELVKMKRRTLFAREGFRTYCGAPLMARGRVLGVLEVMNRTLVRPDAEWLAFLETAAAAAAAAIDGAQAADRVEKSSSHRRQAGAAPRLNALERQILGLLVEGTTNADIAKAVHLSQSTVKFHVRQILQRVGAANRTELARKATREGWL